MSGALETGLGMPLFLLGGLLLCAAATYLLRGWDQFTAAAAALLAGGLGLWLWGLRPQGSGEMSLLVPTLSIQVSAPLERFGFALALQERMLPLLALNFLLVAAAFVLAARTPQGRSFVPLTLVVLAGYLLLGLLSAGPLAPPLVVPLLLIGVSSLSVFALQAGRLGYPYGALRLLLPPVLAAPLFLVAAWHLEQLPLNPQADGSMAAAAQSLGIGLLVLLAPFPLHGGRVATAQSAPPVASALFSLLYELAVLQLFHQLLVAYPFITASSDLGAWLIWSGVGTAVWGGLTATGVNHPGRLWGYASLHDWGLILLALAVPGGSRWPMVLLLFSLRAVSLLTAAAGLAALEHRVGSLSPERLRGVGARLPWNSAAYVLGGLGLAGFPLSAGFTGHWAVLQFVAATDWQLAGVVLLASAGAIFGFVRMVRLLYGPLQNERLLREHPLSAATAAVALFCSVGLAVAPQWLDRLIQHALLAFRG